MKRLLLFAALLHASLAHTLAAGPPVVSSPAAQVVAQAPVAPTPVATSSPLSGQVRGETIEERLIRLERELDSAKQQLVVSIAMVTGAILLFGFFMKIWGYPAVRKWLTATAAEKLKDSAEAAVREVLPGILTTVQKKAEAEVLRLARLLAMKSQGLYDDALLACGWTGSVSSLRDDPPAIRRLVIECLRATRTDPRVNRRLAWEAVQELYRDDKSAETLLLYLDLSITVRRYNEGLSAYEAQRDLVLTNDDCALQAATLLRKLGRLEDARQLLQSLVERNHLNAVASLAALDRDLGRLERCHDLLHARVLDFISSPPARPPRGWNHVLNTYIANCVDRGFPTDAIAAAGYLLRTAPGAVEVFTAGRLACLLPDDAPSRAELVRAFRFATEQLSAGEASLRSRVLLLQLDGDLPGATRALRDAIEEDADKPHEVYFHKCSLGKLLREGGDATGALDELLSACALPGNGEAEYELSLVYAAEGRGRESALFLGRACERLPRWSAVARNEKKLKVVPEVAEFLQHFRDER